MPRTGSTSFQEVLARLRPQLASVGICYPKLAPVGSPEAVDINHHRLGQALDRRRPAADRRNGLARLDAVLSSTQADTVILSYEDFAVQRPRWHVPTILRDVFTRHGYAMDVALVVKPQAEQLGSAYALRAQVLGEAGIFRDFVRRDGFSARYDYAARLRPWREAADDRVVAVPLRDRRSEATLLNRLIDGLGLTVRLNPLLSPVDLDYRTNRSSGPVVVEASRRLRKMGLHRQLTGHPRLLGHFLDEWAWARSLDAEQFRGDAPETLAQVEAHHAESNALLASNCWGCSWDQVVARAPQATANELATRSIPPETEAMIEQLMTDAIAHAAFRAPPAWRQRADYMIGQVASRFAELAGYPIWRVR